MSMDMASYEFDENAGSVEVCAELETAPSGGLDCSIVATLTPQNGDKAGEPGNITIMLFLTLSEPFDFCSLWYGLQCDNPSCGDIHKWNRSARRYFMCTT